jgi:hypothetical protein
VVLCAAAAAAAAGAAFLVDLDFLFLKYQAAGDVSMFPIYNLYL